MRLNLGCGSQVADDWVNVDRMFSGTPPTNTVTWDLRDLPLPFESRSCIGAVAHHVLDLLTAGEMVGLLGDLARVLRPGAKMRVSCADIDRAVERAQHGDFAWFPEPRHHETYGVVDLDATLGFFITQGGARKQLVRAEGLITIARAVGWTSGRALKRSAGTDPDWLAALDSRAGESWYAELVR